MFNIALLLFKYGPLILNAITTTQNVAAALATKPTGTDKLNAARSAVVAVVPAIAEAIKIDENSSMHLDDYISLGVKTLNAVNGWALADDGVAISNTDHFKQLKVIGDTLVAAQP